MKNLKTQGLILIDVDVAALNNAGKSESTNLDNGVATKKIKKNGGVYPYVSGQAWRFWWRETLQKQRGWIMSPIVREKKIAYTNANPVNYPDDDVFGYMRATKAILPGEKKATNVTVTRISPLKNSALVSVMNTKTEEHWSSMTRQEGDAVPYTKEEYSTIMKGMFSLDLAQIGTFSDYNRTGFKNITAEIREDALAKGGFIINDPYVLDKNNKPKELVRLAQETRIKRAKDTISVLKIISGGAMQTNNLVDVTPKFIILVTTNSGNHPFSHIAVSKGLYHQEFELNLEGLQEVLSDYKDQFLSNVFIGHRNGFLKTDVVESLEKLAKQNTNVVLGSVNNIIDQYVKGIEKTMKDASE